MRKLTPAQVRLLDELHAGQVIVRSFDVYGGWWYWLRPTQTRVDERTVQRLQERGLIKMAPEKRIYSGYREAVFSLTEPA